MLRQPTRDSEVKDKYGKLTSTTSCSGRGEGDRAPCLIGWRAARLTLVVRAEGAGGDVAGIESERPTAARAIEVVDIQSDDEADDMVELPVSSWELAVVQSEAGPSGGLSEGDLEWPCPKDPAKVRYVLRDS